jgi:DNA-binding NtrC family response regulator
MLKKRKGRMFKTQNDLLEITRATAMVGCYAEPLGSRPSSTALSGSPSRCAQSQFAQRVSARLLLIDDDKAQMPERLRQVFPASAYQIELATTGTEGLQRISARPPDVILLNRYLPDQCGLEVYRAIRRIDFRIPVIFIASSKGANPAIEAMKQGAYDFLFKPLDLHELRRAVGEALEVARRMRELAVPAETATEPEAPDLGGVIVGSSPAMREVYKSIGRVTSQNVPVLITGESGTGKELVARAIYQHGARAKAPFLALNCAAIPEQLLESELFGHEKGAFTGADRQRIGKFEQCHGGTLFLDEIGDMPLALQSKILRLLQEQSFERVGGNERVQTDVRLIAATHRNLKAWSAEGKFRPDLYYRLGVFTIQLPPLRDRGDDLPQLVQFYLRRFSRDLGREIREAAPEVLDQLQSHSWPGNIRELQSVLKQALLQATGTVLLTAFLPELSDGASKCASAAPATDLDLDAFIRQRLRHDVQDLYADMHRQLDRLLLPRVLDHTGRNQNRAARQLGIARQTLRMKLRDLGLHFTHSVGAGEGKLS